ncbi:MAG: homocysteine S-methyltransferase family protein [Myxococcota bacterium]
MSAGVYRPHPAAADPERRRRARERLAAGEALLLDGATGTELERLGLPTALPLWSAPALIDHPEVVRGVHAAYLAAGVEAVTANTFRTQRHTLAAGGLAERAPELTRTAVALARQAAEDAAAGDAHPALVLGSAPPLADCYRPDRVPDEAFLRAEHAEHARCLDEAGVDAVLVETMNTAGEAEIATGAAVARDLPVLASFVCWDGARLLDGSPLDAAARRALDAGATAVGVNCLPPSNVSACLEVLAACGAPFGVYANLGEPDDASGFRRSEDCSPGDFAEAALRWLAAGAHVLGGCCGTTPDHLAAVRRALSGQER